MTPEAFNRWLDDMREAKLGTTIAACARLLGLNHHSLHNYRKEGCDRRTALACRALLHRMEPYE